VIELVGGRARRRRDQAVLTGVSNTVLTGAQLDTPVSYAGFAPSARG
jgi:hypothetical protein